MSVPRNLTTFELRILLYMEQRGGIANRMNLVCDLARPGSKIGDGHVNGSNGGIPRLFGAWTRHLKARGYIEQVYDCDGYYRHSRLTPTGCIAARSHQAQP